MFPEDPGGGPPDMEVLDADGNPVTREWFIPTEEKGETVSFIEILGQWNLLEADMHHFFGVDLSDPVVKRRPWRWFAVRVDWLLSRDSEVRYALRPPKDTDDTTGHGDT